MSYSLTIMTPATDEPITLVEAKQHCRVTNDVEDDLLASFIAAAREYVEEFTRRILMPTTVRIGLDHFPGGRLCLPHTPVQSITSIKYLDGAGVEQTFSPANYVVDLGSFPPSVSLAYGQSWPQTQSVANAVRIVYVAGYESAAAVPAALKAAIKLYVADLYLNREAQSAARLEKNETAERLIWPYRVLDF